MSKLRVDQLSPTNDSVTINVADLVAGAGLGNPDGYKLIGEVASFAALRLLVPTAANIRVKLRGWNAGSSLGGGDFIAVAGDVADDGGIIARVNSSYYWRRDTTTSITPEMFGAVGDNTTDDSTALIRCFTASGVNGAIVKFNRNVTYLCKAPISIASNAIVDGNNIGAIKRDSTVSTALDFITVNSGVVIRNLKVLGNRLATQAPAEVVLMRIGNKVNISNCDISGSVGYLIVANATNGVVIDGNTMYDVAGYAVALYGDYTAASRDFRVSNNNFSDIGHGAVTVQGYNRGSVEGNTCLGTHVGVPGDRMYVVTNTSGAITSSSGPAFGAIRPGMWVVLPGGGEHRVTAVSSATNITVSPVPPSNATVRAIMGTGDIIGIQSCNYVTVKGNYIDSSVTYGTGGGTMSGNTNQCNYCKWEANFIRNTGKNGINLGQSGAGAASNSIVGNKLVLCGNGGVGSGPSLLMTDFDTAAIALFQANAGQLVNTRVANNEITTFGSDLGVGITWLYMSGLSQGTVVSQGNSQTGYADGFVRGDIINVNLTGYGTGATVSNNVSTGDRVVISIVTGTSPTASPFFVVNKVIRTPTAPVVMGQIATTTGTMSFCWGLQSSTDSAWAAGQNSTPSGTNTYHLHA